MIVGFLVAAALVFVFGFETGWYWAHKPRHRRIPPEVMAFYEAQRQKAPPPPRETTGLDSETPASGRR